MGADAAVERHEVTPPGEDGIAARMRAEGLSPHGWGNGPGDTYGWHEHGYEKVLYCMRGRIVFHTAGGGIELGPGDKMVLPPHTAHAATVGAEGVRCIEATPQQDQSPVDGIRRVADVPDDLSWSGCPLSQIRMAAGGRPHDRPGADSTVRSAVRRSSSRPGCRSIRRIYRSQAVSQG